MVITQRACSLEEAISFTYLGGPQVPAFSRDIIESAYKLLSFQISQQQLVAQQFFVGQCYPTPTQPEHFVYENPFGQTSFECTQITSDAKEENFTPKVNPFQRENIETSVSAFWKDEPIKIEPIAAEKPEPQPVKETQPAKGKKEAPTEEKKASKEPEKQSSHDAPFWQKDAS